MRFQHVIIIFTLVFAARTNGSLIEGQITSYESKDGYCHVQFSSSSQWYRAKHAAMCEFLKGACNHGRDLCAILKQSTSETNGKFLSYSNEIDHIEFANRHSKVFTSKIGQSADYTLFGEVDNVEIFYNGICYISIDDERKSKKLYTNRYHRTTDMDICSAAQRSFYGKDLVIAKVNGTDVPNDANVMIKFKVLIDIVQCVHDYSIEQTQCTTTC